MIHKDMKRVLIVVSCFPPVMFADIHRARMLCHELPRLGWEVEVLAPDADYHRPCVLDDNADIFFSERLVAHSVPTWRNGLFRRFGIGGVGWRALWPMHRAGCRLLRSGRFDLVYFSTTNFVLFCLGRIWRRKFGVPYVLDFHDPWHRESYKYITTQHKLKWCLSCLLARHFERFAVADASGIVSVSPKYLDELLPRYANRKYAWLAEERHCVIPFGALEEDFQAVGRPLKSGARNNVTDLMHVAYVGAGGAVMRESFAAMCRGLAWLRKSEPMLVNRVRFCLYGTSSNGKDGNPRMLQAVAEAEGVGDLVEESPCRTSYSESLQLARDAQGLLVLGVDDAGYVPSKLFSYALSGKPLLGLFHTSSPALEHFKGNLELGHVIRFGPGRASSVEESAEILKAFFSEVAGGRTWDRRKILQPFLAPAMAEAHAELFERCVVDRKRN